MSMCSVTERKATYRARHLALRRVATVAALGLLSALGAPDSARAQGSYTLQDVSFLAGCWAGRMGSLDMTEQWTDAEGGVMLGTTRYLRDGSVVDWEFARMVADDTGVTLWPYPRGVISEHGFPLVSTAEEHVFENLAHDFPVRIVYAREGDDALTPRIEGRDGDARGWSLNRVDCPGS